MICATRSSAGAIAPEITAAASATPDPSSSRCSNTFGRLASMFIGPQRDAILVVDDAMAIRADDRHAARCPQQLLLNHRAGIAEFCESGDVANRARDAALKALLEGVQMTERELLNTLERHGISRLEPKGERFDPNRHQAMFEVADADAVSNTVVQVVQAGYVIGDRVLRPAMVGVAKGGPKEAAEPAPETADEKAEKEA